MVIFPNYSWIHDKQIGVINGISFRTRPDYRCEEQKIIIEFDGIQHYSNPEQILKDYKQTTLYQNLGYNVYRIPYFIPLTNKNVKTIFNKTISIELFPENIVSMSIEEKSTPAFLCPLGIKRMAKEFLRFKNDYYINLNYLKTLDENLSGAKELEYYYNQLNKQ